MPNNLSTAYCNVCKKTVNVKRNEINHILHLLLTLVLCGFWAVVWLLITLTTDTRWRCSECGSIV